MKLEIELSSETETMLQAQARVRGLTAGQWLLQLAEQAGPPLNEEQPGAWEQEFDEWLNGFPDTPPLSDEAIGRASLHPDRW